MPLRDGRFSSIPLQPSCFRSEAGLGHPRDWLAAIQCRVVTTATWPAPRSVMHLDGELQRMIDHPCDCAMFRN
ncbi:MAG: hypothetical protein E5V67_09565 [Mesorhizobium sp.]|nr:hypothetical protein EOA91_00700 [Mesorhizobium sp. M1A.F.Ca.IN.022.04.1.1]RWG37018.1 MAG: hypothetical protein EOQ60_02560 [Mesorhizobium sp.]TGQ21218.1 hypothetical protein EN860_013915 [Mesorhizobium sp. M00.F.Ca.ET.217.01.1.1]TGV95176.1 hypothetical protein EN801_006180 [Mesorhizobium sp. M00.F.Ca.ET.158.01.1.1]TIT99881.1 MAG: hypothetical protein E5W43_10445 [Mesorhizobium sp.]